MNTLKLGKEYLVGEWYCVDDGYDGYILKIKPLDNIIFSSHKGWKYNFRDKVTGEKYKIGHTEGVFAKQGARSSNKIVRPSRAGDYCTDRSFSTPNVTNEYVKQEIFWEVSEGNGVLVYATPVDPKIARLLQVEEIRTFYKENSQLPRCNKNFN
jgi:hypothetical protein